jgi:pimeloyl-ACP methyl ester carboxylesterase
VVKTGGVALRALTLEENTLAIQATLTRRILRWLVRILSAVVVLAVLLGGIFYFRPLMVLSALTRPAISVSMWRQGIHSSNVQIGQYNIHYLVAGTGRPLVLVHGLGGSAGDWMRWILEFKSKGFRVYALDLLGFGRSDSPDVDYSISLQSSIVRQFLDNQGLRHPDVVGVSMGGWISLKLAVDSPERIGRLVLLDSAGLTFDPVNVALLRPESFEQLLKANAIITSRPSTALPGFIARDALRISKQNWAGGRALDSMLSGKDLLDGKLGAVTMPVFIAWGRQDLLIPLSVGEAMHREMPQSTLFVAEGGGHIAAFQCQDKIIPEVEKFLVR